MELPCSRPVRRWHQSALISAYQNWLISALTGDSRTPRLASRASDYVALVGTPEPTLLETIPVGDAPGWAEADEAGRTCLIANTRSDEILVLSIPDQREVARAKIGDGPNHITVARAPAAVLSRLKPAS